MKLFLLAGLGLVAGPLLAQPTAPASLVSTAPHSTLKTHALRLRPGDDLRQQLTAFVLANHIQAGTMLTCVGSLTVATLRLANQEGPSVYKGHFEIVSLVGTLSTNGSHLHLAVSDSTGRTIGGHLLDGCKVYTTAEIVLGELPQLEFRREKDDTFGYQELVVRPAPAPVGEKGKARKH
ncbi:PPC domain-containing DNA-binding protein [Hymenobacter negativus]|uniref:DNA-binding protein n=1 Tax=Hymenobacter negativus TaxID=2795026 RepID=A0ABS0QAB5_9BACT|nr:MULTISPECIES: PPC domain-containing DNA-binding protein [Bacteria]MBH8559525.1 DNA-binding protein [Hymenobacter negativus]MBH8568457.1 DNA-binding protein [Hymenobacter negativus]MBR7208192.1 DNA-binding protein [Microvirga sp. STS02]